MNVMQNAINGAIHQYELSGDAACHGDLELAKEHWDAAELLEDFAREYIPIEGEL
jgi:hypothetical protein